MSNVITDKKSAQALVKFERDRSKVVYSDYIANNGVTLDNVADHVQALAGLAFPKFDQKTADDDAKKERKAFCTRVRNGLNYRLGKTSKRAESDAPEQEGREGADDAENGPENGEESPTVTLTPEESLRMAIRALIGSGMSREDVLTIVSSEFHVSVQVAA